jgi:pimeloyl-ACP methyl ester carboxylesterase
MSARNHGSDENAAGRPPVWPHPGCRQGVVNGEKNAHSADMLWHSTATGACSPKRSRVYTRVWSTRLARSRSRSSLLCREAAAAQRQHRAATEHPRQVRMPSRPVKGHRAIPDDRQTATRRRTDKDKPTDPLGMGHTLLMVGRYDPQTPVRVSQALHERNPGTRLVIFDGAGIPRFWREPQRFAHVLTDFLRYD